ncbi:MAG TPA: ABC transporter substrate-binding protein [Symbiobacteriaceae bacterium]|jgi:peptide/nickel transport system substrate-binding protein
MKRYLVLLLLAFMVILAATPTSAARPEQKYPVTFNGHPIGFDVEPQNVNGRVFVPFRAIFEKMGAKVYWDEATQTVSADREETSINLTIGNKTAYVNSNPIQLSDAPFIKNGSTLIPLRFVGEALGGTVTYDPATTAIAIVDLKYPKRGGTLNMAMWNKPDGNFHPEVASDTYSNWVSGMMYDGLWRYDAHIVPQPALADGWDWDASNTILTFYLRPDAKFHDGKPVTADDVIISFKGMMHPKYVGPRNSGWDALMGYDDYTKGINGETKANFEKGVVTATPLAGLYKLDDHTVVFRLAHPDAAFFITQTVFGIIDGSKYTKVPVQEWGLASDPYNTKAPNGTGPFKMTEYAEGQYVVLVANDNYWSGRPYIDKVVWRVLSSDVAVGEFKLGKLDIAEAEADTLDYYRVMNNLKIAEFPDLVYQELMFNWAKGPTSEKAVRHAIAYGIDRMAIIHNLLKDHGGTMYTPLHPLLWAATEDVEKYGFNPDRARQILDEAGWKVGPNGIRVRDGKKLHIKMTYPNVGNPVRRATAPVLQQMMKDIGIEVELVGYDWPTINTKVFDQKDFDMLMIGWQVVFDPDPTGMWDKSATAQGGFNAGGFVTDESERLIKEAKTNPDIEFRQEVYRKWGKLWAEELPAYIFYAKNTTMAYNDRVKNFNPLPGGLYYWNLEELWLSK